MKRILSLAILSACLLVRADTTTTNLLVSQRWPWSEKVDVDFVLAGEPADVDVSAMWDGQPKALLGTVFAAAPGAHRFTWDPSTSPWAGRTLTGFSVSLAPVAENAHTYLAIDLESGGYAYLPDVPAGGWDVTYKTRKMVFRRIPAGTYQLGMDSNVIAKVNGAPISAACAKAWRRHDITFTSDFYVGVFKMTIAQHNLLTGAAPGVNLRPKELSYDELRGSVAEGYNWPTSQYAVAENSLVARLRSKAGFLIDLCQECQWEAAMRAGTTTIWPSGGTPDDDAVALTNAATAVAWLGGSHDVGLKAPNAWGLYDPIGNGTEWTLDKANKNSGDVYPNAAVSNGTDPVGKATAYATYRVTRGGSDRRLIDVLPCRRALCAHAAAAATVRFCIHLKPLNVPK